MVVAAVTNWSMPAAAAEMDPKSVIRIYCYTEFADADGLIDACLRVQRQALAEMEEIWKVARVNADFARYGRACEKITRHEFGGHDYVLLRACIDMVVANPRSPILDE